MTLAEITNGISLTEKETTILSHLYSELSSYFGEEYSDIDCNDVSKSLNMDVKTVKGVVGSLVKKEILNTYDTGTGFDVISFVRQDEMQ